MRAAGGGVRGGVAPGSVGTPGRHGRDLHVDAGVAGALAEGAVHAGGELGERAEGAGELGGVLGEELEGAARGGREADDRVLVGAQEAVDVLGGAGGARVGGGEVALLLGEGAAGGGEVLERVDDAGRGVGVHVRHRHELLQVLVERGEFGVEPLEVRVEFGEGLAELVAASVERPRDGGECRGELLRLDGGEQRKGVVEDLLEFDGVRRAVLRDDGPGAERRARLRGVGDECHVPLAEEGGGEHLGADVVRDGLECPGFHREGEAGSLPRGVDGADLADDDAAQLDLGADVHLVAHAAGLDDDARVVAEVLLVDGDGEPDEQGGDDEEGDAREAQAQGPHVSPPPSPSWWRPRSRARGRSR
ncbi:putative secreted protein [Streptomyces sp. Tu6071]|nr:putative secreted protein [Streptomyces sp. Tu6071]